MSNTLIIAEKPSVAARIASALGNGKTQRSSNGKYSFYSIKKDTETIFIAPAVGHLFTIKQKGNERGYPILNVEWAPSYAVSKNSAFTKGYLDTIRKLSTNCDTFINACDYDTEGTVIGTNIIKDVTKLELTNLGKKAKRMKFSTTTDKDLLDSYKNIQPLDFNNYYAGETRHILDWLWGINFSRALTSALSGSLRTPLSIGRVQGPTLSILSRREIEIKDFKPQPFWKITLEIKKVKFTNSKGNISDKDDAYKAFEETKNNLENAVVNKIDIREEKRLPPPPFDLTSLQIEASHVINLDPSLTLSLAQSLYEKSYISYPRTSSQKLPYTLGLPNIIEQLSKIPDYKEITSYLIQNKKFKPIEGKKTDEAHPSIFPTGILPNNLSRQEQSLYDLIVRRFLSCFSDPATISHTNISVGIAQQTYKASGMQILKKGWIEVYKYARLNETEIPEFKEGEKVRPENLDIAELQTQPPKRYTKAGIIAELEKRGLGTKATRAAIVDTLFKRNYVIGNQLQVTEFGLSVYNALLHNCEMIIDERTTEKLDLDLEDIVNNKTTEEKVIEKGKKLLLEAIDIFNKNKVQIGNELKSTFRSANSLGKCPKCGGDLVIRHSRAGKQFVACSNYPNCTVTYSLPQSAKIVPTGKVCEYCKTPIIRVIRKGKRTFEMDLDPNCITKKDYKAKFESKFESKVINAVPATELKNKEVKTENSDKEKPKVKRKYTKKSDKKTTTTKATKKKRQKEKKGTK
jgi:DNA topoisomerase-1